MLQNIWDSLETFLQENPFYYYFLLFCVFGSLVKKFADWLIAIYLEHRKK